MKLLRKLFSTQEKARQCTVLDFGEAKNPVYAIGDVHGCANLLDRLLLAIEEDARAKGSDYGIVVLGDFIDRGPSSSDVVSKLIQLERTGRVLTLMGNHERMFVQFVDAPHQNAAWLDEGGYETLASYGIHLSSMEMLKTSGRRIQQTLHAAVTDGHLEWIRALPHAASVTMNGETCIFCHAGYDLSRDERSQTERTLLWGQNGSEGSDTVRIVHGHFVTSSPKASARRIIIDTGAWKSGVLSCVRLTPGAEPSVISVGNEIQPKRKSQ